MSSRPTELECELRTGALGTETRDREVRRIGLADLPGHRHPPVSRVRRAGRRP